MQIHYWLGHSHERILSPDSSLILVFLQYMALKTIRVTPDLYMHI